MSAEPVSLNSLAGDASHFGFGHNHHFDSGLAAFETGEIALAKDQFLVCMASDPDPSTRERARSYLAGCFIRLAKADMEMSDWESALENLEEATFYRPAFADGRILRSKIFDRLGRTEDRQFEITFALNFNPKFALAALHEGILEVEYGDESFGIKRIQESISLDKRLHSPLFKEALALYESGKKAQAMELFKNVVPVFENDPAEHIKIGNLAAHNGRWAEAEDAYRNAIEIAPRYADVRCKYGRVLLALGHVDEAIAQFREAVEINPRYADAYAFLGVALKTANHLDQSADAINAALALDPGHVVALNA